MGRLVIYNAAEQVAAHLRQEIQRGVWSGKMPGSDKLSTKLGIGCNTAEAALALLEKEGFLYNQGRRRGRLINPQAGAAGRPLRVVILHGDAAELKLDYIVEISHKLGEAGHTARFAPKSMEDLGMDLGRITRMARKTEADAWVVFAGSSELLDWFAGCGKPTFALFGRRRGKRIAGTGPDKRGAYIEATRRLAEFGHRRIVLLVRPRRRLPQPGLLEQTFLDALADLGLPVGAYNLPDWEESVEGFHACLESLFLTTPPTALIVDEAAHFFAAQQFLDRWRLRVPEDVSLICTDPSPDFDWSSPAISHIHWDSSKLARRVLKWATDVSRGKTNHRQTHIPADFVTGGTIGPAPEEE